MKGAGEPRHVKVQGEWLDLTGREVLPGFLEVWKRHLSSEPVDVEPPSGSTFKIPAWQAERGAAFLTTWRWVGGTPGDACEYEFRIRFEDGTLMVTAMTDSCWMPGIRLTFYEPAGRRDDLAAEFSAVLTVIEPRRDRNRHRRTGF